MERERLANLGREDDWGSSPWEHTSCEDWEPNGRCGQREDEGHFFGNIVQMQVNLEKEKKVRRLLVDGHISSGRRGKALSVGCWVCGEWWTLGRATMSRGPGHREHGAIHWGDQVRVSPGEGDWLEGLRARHLGICGEGWGTEGAGEASAGRLASQTRKGSKMFGNWRCQWGREAGVGGVRKELGRSQILFQCVGVLEVEEFQMPRSGCGHWRGARSVTGHEVTGRSQALLGSQRF